MRLIDSEAEPYLAAEPPAGPPAAVVAVLEREYGSWRRLAAGAAALALLTVGVAVAGLGLALAAAEDFAAAERMLLAGVGLAVGAALAVPGGLLGRAVVRAGRSVVDALVRWHDPLAARPGAQGEQPTSRRRLTAAQRRVARAYAYRPPMFGRVATGGLLLVATLVGWGMVAGGLALATDPAERVLAGTFGGLAVPVTAATAYVLGGAYRVQAAHTRGQARR